MEPQSFFANAERFVSLHGLDGRYEMVNETAFALEGIDGSMLVGNQWQDFCPSDEIDRESIYISRALFTGKPVVQHVTRHWPRRSIRCIGSISAVVSKGGTTMILREGTLIVDAPSGADAWLDHHPVRRKAETAAFIEAELQHLLELDPDLIPPRIRSCIEEACNEAIAAKRDARKRLLS